MRVPFVDLGAAHRHLRESLMSVFEVALDTNQFIGGRMVQAFEEDFAAFCETRFCVGVNSGTDALRFALVAAGVRPPIAFNRKTRPGRQPRHSDPRAVRWRRSSTHYSENALVRESRRGTKRFLDPIADQLIDLCDRNDITCLDLDPALETRKVEERSSCLMVVTSQ